MWLVDRVAFEVYYLHKLEAVETWNKNTNYGSLVQAGIEGYIKTRQRAGAIRLIDNEFKKQCSQHSEYDEIAFWASLAGHQVDTWIRMYGNEIEEHGFTDSEKHHEIVLELPSGRQIKLHGFIDGESNTMLMENKCRGEWDETVIVQEIAYNLQVNLYTMFFESAHQRLPERIWYQHIRRPNGFGYRGPRQKAKESTQGFLSRLREAIDSDRDYHFFRYWIIPDRGMVDRFRHRCLYPMLEAFLDWYEYMSLPSQKGVVNKVHWMTPYGLYNPFMEGTAEKFRNFRLTGCKHGLRPRSMK